MNFEFPDEGDFSIIKISGTVGVNERLLAKNSLAPCLRHSHGKVIVDLNDLRETGGVYIPGVLNNIKVAVSPHRPPIPSSTPYYSTSGNRSAA
jgi:hypothetical protein